MSPPGGPWAPGSFGGNLCSTKLRSEPPKGAGSRQIEPPRGSTFRGDNFFQNFLRKCWSSCGLLGAARWPWEALEAIFVEQRFGLNPREGQGGDGLSPQEGRLQKKKVENVGPVVGSLGRPDGPEKLWEQSLLNEWWAQTLQGFMESTG